VGLGIAFKILCFGLAVTLGTAHCGLTVKPALGHLYSALMICITIVPVVPFHSVFFPISE
jgi:hypothetical protein